MKAQEPGEKSMYSALYFPHTTVHSERVIRTALLLWDQLDFIAPDRSYRPSYRNRAHEEAMEIVGRKRVPTQREKEKVHRGVQELIRYGVPESFHYSPSMYDRQESYGVWPEKILDRTWRLLRDNHLTEDLMNRRDYPMSAAAGLTIMAILADAMAGNTKTRITDRGQAYASIANAPKTGYDAEAPMLVVPLTFSSIGVDAIPLEKLIELRQREAADTTNDYRALRHRYLDSVELHIRRISEVPLNSSDRTELDRQFVATMEGDLRDLKSELGIARKQALLTHHSITLVVAGSALLSSAAGYPLIPVPPEFTSILGGIGVLGGLMGTHTTFAKERREILRRHPMSYLYQLGGG